MSDAILDAILAQDPYGRVACETGTTTGLIMVFGEITTKALIDYQELIRADRSRHWLYLDRLRVRCRYVRRGGVDQAAVI